MLPPGLKPLNTNKTIFNLIIFYFDIRGKSKIRCDNNNIHINFRCKVFNNKKADYDHKKFPVGRLAWKQWLSGFVVALPNVCSGMIENLRTGIESLCM